MTYFLSVETRLFLGWYVVRIMNKVAYVLQVISIYNVLTRIPMGPILFKVIDHSVEHNLFSLSNAGRLYAVGLSWRGLPFLFLQYLDVTVSN